MANSVLKEHRGWKQVFANVGFAVASLSSFGIANLISKIATGSAYFGKVNTDAANKIHDMKTKLAEIKSHEIAQESDDEESSAPYMLSSVNIQISWLVYL